MGSSPLHKCTHCIQNVHINCIFEWEVWGTDTVWIDQLGFSTMKSERNEAVQFFQKVISYKVILNTITCRFNSQPHNNSWNILSQTELCSKTTTKAFQASMFYFATEMDSEPNWWLSRICQGVIIQCFKSCVHIHIIWELTEGKTIQIKPEGFFAEFY